VKTITVAAAVILNEQNQLLLVRKRNTHAFMQVGGKLEPNEAPEITMQREILEEVGSSCVIEQFLGRFETDLVQLDQAPKIAAEIAEMKWVDLNDSETHLAPLTREIVIPWCEQHLSTV